MGDGPAARLLDFLNGVPSRRRARRDDGSSASALRRFGCSQEPALAKAGDTVVAGVRHMVGGRVRREVRTFKTTTKDLMALSEWLSAEGCTHIAMEATGIYWKPVWHVLGDGEFELVLANAAHVKNVPGRKTDVNDATWLADLMAHGLIRGSFVPDAHTQELRALLRTCKQFVRERSSHIQRLQKTLEDANIKLDSALSDVMGLSGQAMIEALIAGESDPDTLAGLAHRRVKARPEDLREALRGRVTKHHRFLLQLHLQQVDAIDAAISEIDREVDANVEPFRTAITLLTTIPGVSDLSARVIIAEIGNDMSRFPTEGHLISCAGLCPKNDESPTEPARRLRSRRGVEKAIGAVAASILTAAYHMLAHGTLYHDLGPDHFDRTAKATQTRRLIARLHNLGYAVQITPLAP